MNEPRKGSLGGELAALWSTRLILFGVYRMVFPFLPVFARGLGLTLEQVSIAVSARTLAVVVSPLMGVLADRLGRKPVMLLGLG